MLVTIARPEGLFYLIFIAPERDWDEARHTYVSVDPLCPVANSRLALLKFRYPHFWIRARRSSGRNVKQCSGGYN